MGVRESLQAFLPQRLPYVAVSSYAEFCCALYVGRWSFHWSVDGPVKVIDAKVVTVHKRPRRSVTVYNGLHTVLGLNLWPHKGFCPHGHKWAAWWHRCDYVSAENPTGRVPDRELYPEDYDENGVHVYDRTCFCDLKPDYSICSMHPDEDDDE